MQSVNCRRVVGETKGVKFVHEQNATKMGRHLVHRRRVFKVDTEHQKTLGQLAMVIDDRANFIYR